MLSPLVRAAEASRWRSATDRCVQMLADRPIRSRALPRTLFLWVVAVAILNSGPLAAAAGPTDPGRQSPYFRSYVVRLKGPSLWEVRKAQHQRAARSGRAGPDGLLPTDGMELLALQRAYAGRLAQLAPGIESTGARIVARLEAVTFGYIVSADEAAAESVARMQEVASVAPAPLLEPARSEVVPQIGARAVWDDLGLDGRDILVAVLDTGIDYTHADFGGPGTPGAYSGNNENVVESGTFPTRKVVGGYDLAGERYSPHPSCIEPNPPSQICTRIAIADDDPLDSRGHGTHVAGIVAGNGLPELEKGVAPLARLVSLKIFGNPIDAPVVTDLMHGAFDWVFKNNLELELPGWPTDPIQVIDMSLSAAWLGGTHETKQLVRAANEAGITVVVAAGNDGDMPYFMGPLAGAETALTVGATWPTGQRGLVFEATWAAGAREGMAFDTRIVGQTMTRDRPIEGDLAWVGSACPGAEPVQPVSGKVALVERGECGFADKMTTAQSLGATGVVVFSSPGLPPQEMGGEGALSIPGAMIDRESGLALKEALEAGAVVTIRVFEPNFDVLGGTIAAFSSRGPSRFEHGLKPQLVAPGLRVTSGAMGTGSGVEAQSGTSMAASVAAGAAAVVWERNRSQQLGLSADDVAALLVNHANPAVHLDRSANGTSAPVARRGAGFLDLVAATKANTLVRSASGLAEVDFGLIHVTESAIERTSQLTVRNLSDQERRYRVTWSYLSPEEDAGHGVTVDVSPANLVVPARGSALVDVNLRLEPAQLRPWNLYATEAVIHPELVQEMEVDGLVEVLEVDAGGSPVSDGDRVTVPALTLAARHSCISSRSPGVIAVSGPGDTVAGSWANPCPTDGWVNQYVHVGSDASESTVPAALDIIDVGFRRYLGEMDDEGEADIIMEWAIRTRGPRRTPAAAQFRVYIDVDNDGTFDSVIYNLDALELGRYVTESFERGRWLNAQGPLVEGSLEPDHFAIRAFTYQPYQLDETTTVLVASADEMGIDLRTTTESFRFAVAAVDLSGDHERTSEFPGYDYAPDGLTAVGGDGFVYEQLVHDCLIFEPAVPVPGGGEATSAYEMYCEEPRRDGTFGIMFDYTTNAPGPRAADVRPGVFGAAPLGSIYLPHNSVPDRAATSSNWGSN